ncbi:hypothetical protein JXB27_00240 [Candidatus Woesearchaeota archaeon]|nr:hypothetical protein [Candidatus Woesearchaeota archaeon]
MFDRLQRLLGLKMDCPAVSIVAMRISSELKRLFKALENRDPERKKNKILRDLNGRAKFLIYESKHEDEAGAKIKGAHEFEKAIRLINILTHQTSRTTDFKKEIELKDLILLSIQHMDKLEKDATEIEKRIDAEEREELKRAKTREEFEEIERRHRKVLPVFNCF